jgi:anti-anti-sigma factor
MEPRGPLFDVQEAGERIVIGVAGRDYLGYEFVSQCRDGLKDLIRRNNCKTLALDLTGVMMMQSDVLGMLVALHNDGVAIELLNPSEEVRAVLAVTRLDTILKIRGS